MDPEQDTRGAPDLDPLRSMLDRTPEGRATTGIQSLTTGADKPCLQTFHPLAQAELRPGNAPPFHGPVGISCHETGTSRRFVRVDNSPKRTRGPPNPVNRRSTPRPAKDFNRQRSHHPWLCTLLLNDQSKSCGMRQISRSRSRDFCHSEAICAGGCAAPTSTAAATSSAATGRFNAPSVMVTEGAAF
jgi:hypothetical protein